MTGAAHVRAVTLLEHLVRADLGALIVDLPVRGSHLLLVDVLEAFRGEVSLLLGDPFLKAEVRFDDEFAHGNILSWATRYDPVDARSAEIPLLPHRHGMHRRRRRLDLGRPPGRTHDSDSAAGQVHRPGGHARPDGTG